MKIRSYQTGGIVYTPFISNIDDSQAEQTTNASTGSEKITGTFTKEVVDILKENGIPSDVDAFMEQANNFLSRSRSLSTASLFGGESDDYDIADVMKVHAMANRVKFNKEGYDRATTQLEEERAWGEVAITNNGQMYVYSEDGGLSTVSPTEYYKNQEKYTALTNSQVLGMRAQNQGLSFNESILNDMSHAVGMEGLLAQVKSAIKDFGTTQIEGYTKNQKQSIENGFQQLMMGGPEGYYKYSQSSQIDKADQQDVQNALSFIYSTLSPNMKQLLKAKTAAEGENPNTGATQRLLYMALMEYTSEAMGVDFDSAATTAGNGGGSNGSEIQKTYLEDIEGVAPTPIENYRIAPENSKTTLWAKGQDLSRLVTKTDQPVQRNNLAVLMGITGTGENSAYALSVGDQNSVTFGETLIDTGDLHKLYWDGGSTLKKIWLPYKNVDGKIMPDFDLQEKIVEVNEYFANHDITPIEKQRIVSEYTDGKGVLDENGDVVINQNSTMGFLSLPVYAGKDTLAFDTDSEYLEKVDREKGRQITDLYDNYMRFGKSTPGKDDLAEPGNTSTRGDFYKGNIFIPVTNIGAGVLRGNNERLPEAAYQNIQPKVQASAQRRGINTNFR